MLNVFIGDMYNRYICPLQPCRHLTLKLLIQGHPQSVKVTHIAAFKTTYIILIIRAASEHENAPRFLVLEESTQTRLIA